MSRKLIIDAQIFQTPAWHRGMGKYSFDLLRSLTPKLLSNSWSEVEILLSSELMCETDMLTQIDEKLPTAKVIRLALQPNKVGDINVIINNRLIIDRYIRKSTTAAGDVDFLVLSLMQGEIYPTFPTAHQVNKIVLFYDLVPLMFFDMYLRNPITRDEYLSKINELVKADLFLAISKTVANDLSAYLGIDKSRIVSIEGGPANHADSQKKMNIPKPFILMPTGNDLRKNNERAILGFNKFNKEHNNKFNLVITSYFKDFQIEELSALSADVVFTGNVSGKELSYLYQNCEGLLFPSEYEGLGLPILEALEYGKPVACSNIAVFREISKTALYYFDPYSVADIAAGVESIVSSPTVDTKAYENILEKYSWEKTADKVIRALIAINKPKKIPHKQKVAIFGADPSNYSQAGNFMQMAYMEVARQTDCHFYIGQKSNPEERRVSYLPYCEPSKIILPGLHFSSSHYSNVIYNLDDNPSSAGVIFMALSNPGLLVLHELPGEAVWKSMEEMGLISLSRLTLETKMAQELNQPYYLASLLLSRNIVVVFDEQAKQAVESIANVVNQNLRIVLLDMPTRALVYDDILPQKVVPICRASAITSSAQQITDFTYNEELAKTRVLIVEDESEYFIALDAMRYGTVPAMSSAIAKRMRIPSSAYLKIIKSKDCIAVAGALIDDNVKYEALSLSVRGFIQNHSSFRQYVTKLDELLTDLPPAVAKGSRKV